MLTKIHSYFYGLPKVKLFVGLTIIPLAIFIIASIAGEVIQPDTNVVRPEFDPIMRAELILSLLLGVTVLIILLYERLIFNFGTKFVGRSRKGSGLLITIILFGYVFTTISFATITYRPAVDSGFAILLLPYALFHAVWFVPLVEFSLTFFARLRNKS